MGSLVTLRVKLCSGVTVLLGLPRDSLLQSIPPGWCPRWQGAVLPGLLVGQLPQTGAGRGAKGSL